MKRVLCLLIVWLITLPASAQQATREEFKELCQAMAGRWVGDVTWIMDWPGFGKRGDKVTGYTEIKVVEDGHVLFGRFFGGPGSSVWTVVYDAAAKQIRENGCDSGGTTWVAVISKKDGKWHSAEKGSHADGTKYEGRYTLTLSDNGNKRTSSGPTTIAGKKADDLNDVWRRVSK